MLNNLKVGILVFVVFISGCAGNYTTSSGKKRNAWVDLLVVAAAMPDSNDSARTRARKSGFINGYLSKDEEEDDYDANCACPYDRASDNKRCGGRSAWSRNGGATPNCDYDSISDQDFEDRWEYERRNNN
jgi:hypothetical protein